MKELQFLNEVRAEYVCEPGDEETVANAIAEIPGVRSVTVAGITKLVDVPDREPVEAG